ncbi:LacI family DNA-binding transcriptional regulator [Clostridium gasigenes]|uniref:LacI family DNA-binding transcriptional regulator n=1 Tax=Clostridium gasigenes TaxID=94869 RepID=UPI001FD52E59|nr:LacI family DNA-binding transcriptional regulator [Clostridium gasigenes]
MSKVTIKDIAQMAQTSKTTVSFYLNGKFDKMSEETRSKIGAVIKEAKYTPSMLARGLTSKKLNLIGVIVADITNPFSSTIVKGIDYIARKEDYQIIVGSSNLDYKYEKNYVDKMLAMGVDGFIVQPTIKFNALISKIKDEGKQIVFIDSVSDDFVGKWVKTNNYGITVEAVNQLIDKGYENFTLITEDPNLLNVRLERREGFVDTLSKGNIPYSVEILDNDVSSEQLEEVISKSIKKDKKNLIFAINGKVLQKIYDVVKSKGLDIPNQVGIIGFDNWEWTHYATPSVTTIDQPTFDEGKYAAKILIDSIEHKESKIESKTFKCNIEWKDSTNISKI